MTEADWLACENPAQMLKYLQGNASDRKLRLFGCGSCRRHWHLLTDNRSRAAVEMAELWADDLVTEVDLEAAESAADRATQDIVRTRQASEYAVSECFTYAARAVGFLATVNAFGTDRSLVVASYCNMAAYHEAPERDCPESENAALCRTIRDIFGNPFRPVSFSPEWRTSTAVALAAQMYESRDFSAMPILADALQDAGCDNADILDHCSSASPHVRGCWVVDLILSKDR
jgi:hypothetical protein